MYDSQAVTPVLVVALTLVGLACGSHNQQPMVLTEGLSGTEKQWGWEGSKVGAGPFAGVTLAEAVGMMGTLPIQSVRPGTPVHMAYADENLPKSFNLEANYSTRCNAVSRVLQQGACGSCYAMASTMALSAAVCISRSGDNRNGSLPTDIVLSTQDLLACGMVNDPGTSDGCKGGNILDALIHLCKDGAAEETCVPYTAGDTWRDSKTVDACRKTCSMPQVHARRRMLGGSGLPCEDSFRVLNTEAAVKSAIMSVGPAVAYIDAYRSLAQYKGGIYRCPQPSRCTRSDIGAECPLPECNEHPDCALHPPGPGCPDCRLGGHAVQIVGWGTENRGEEWGNSSYWVIKNTWGEKWGEKGYARVDSSQEGNCNLFVDCTDPTRAAECEKSGDLSVSPNNPYGPLPSLLVESDTQAVPDWEQGVSWALFGSSLASSLACLSLCVVIAASTELWQFPFNRAFLLSFLHLLLSLSQAARVPFAAFGLVDLPRACNLAGQAFLLSSLAIGGAVAVTGMSSMVIAKISPVSRREGCGARGICMPSFLVYVTMCLCLPIGMTLIFHTSGGDFWPTTLHCAVHSLRLNQLLFDLPMGSCLVTAAATSSFCLLFPPVRDDAVFKGQHKRSREWTFSMLQRVVLFACVLWVPSAALQTLIAADNVEGYEPLLAADALVRGFGGLMWAAYAALTLEIDRYLEWRARGGKAVQPRWARLGDGGDEEEGGEEEQGEGLLQGGTFYEPWAVAAEGWIGEEGGGGGRPRSLQRAGDDQGSNPSLLG